MGKAFLIAMSARDMLSDGESVEPRSSIILGVGVIFAAPRVAELVAGEQHGSPMRQQHGGEHVTLLSFAHATISASSVEPSWFQEWLFEGPSRLSSPLALLFLLLE